MSILPGLAQRSPVSLSKQGLPVAGKQAGWYSAWSMIGAALVTGGAGFIGSHLVGRLVADGCPSIKTLDSLEFGSWDNLPTPGEQVCPITADIRHMPAEAMEAALQGVDVLFHLAAQKHTHRIDSASKVLDANVVATERLFRAAAAAKVRRIVFTSSLFAYGRVSGPPLAESDVATPSTIYGVSKLAGEGLVRTLCRDSGIEGVSLRLFFIYGPRQFVGLGYPSVIIRSFDRILSGLAPTVYGDGQQSLDYLYVDDAVDAILLAARTPHASGDVFNVGSGNATKVADLISTASEVAGFRGNAEPMPADWTANTCRVAEPTKSREILGWRSTTPLREGLERTFHWMRTRA